MTYAAPIADMVFAMKHVAGLDAAIADGQCGDLDADTAAAMLEEAGKLAGSVLAPLNRSGDKAGARLKDGAVTAAPGFADAYRQWREAGWASVTGPAEFGGMGLPHLFNAACSEMWNSANLAFSLCPLLTAGAVEALAAHGTPALRERYLAKLVSGEWTGTMNLTEPQAGSDLSALRTKAVPAGDGTYKITGNKIFITYGEHDMADNIVHLVLARLPDAPAGTRGISLFLVPKILPDGSHNDLRCSGLEHKLGIHASPTCSMAFGDGGGATGWLIGQENKGLACMFTMMNNARLNVALQGVAVAERAFQQARAFAGERKQGKSAGETGAGMSLIIHHADVRRMLMTMKALTAAARAICYLNAASIDRAHREADPARRAAANERAGLLTPVAKAFATDIGNEVASLNVQVHGGMGFVEETGAAQHLRDARILPIYEGTNGIQAIDLVTRKLALSGGAAVRAEIASMRDAVEAVRSANIDTFGKTAMRLGEAVDALDAATAYMLHALADAPDDALAGATPYLRLFALARGGTAIAEGALTALRSPGGGDADKAAHVATARFFAENLAPAAGGLATIVCEGAGSVAAAPLALNA